jgi:hypothetical protein
MLLYLQNSLVFHALVAREDVNAKTNLLKIKGKIIGTVEKQDSYVEKSGMSFN